MSLWQLPFGIHVITETLAAASFILRPETQLATPDAETKLVLQLLGGLLLTTNLIAIAIATRHVFDETSRLVAAAFTFWHLWPSYRAYARLTGPATASGAKTRSTLGGPLSHLSAHVLLVAMFAGVLWYQGP